MDGNSTLRGREPATKQASLADSADDRQARYMSIAQDDDCVVRGLAGQGTYKAHMPQLLAVTMLAVLEAAVTML